MEKYKFRRKKANDVQVRRGDELGGGPRRLEGKKSKRTQMLMDVVESIEVSPDSFCLLRGIGNEVICAE